MDCKTLWNKLKVTWWMKIILTITGPFRSLFLLYYADLINDANLTLVLYNNCHYVYATISVGIFVLSYITTVLYLRLNENQTWPEAIFYHLQHVKNFLVHLKNNISFIGQEGKELPEQSAEEEKFSHNISFLEALTESLPQLCLQMVVIREFGISTNNWEKFTQILNLATSLTSFCVLFSKVSWVIKLRYSTNNFCFIT